MKIGICCHPNEAAGLPADAFDFIEVNVQNFLVPEKGEEHFRAHVEETRMAIKPIKSANCFLPAGLKCTGPDLDEERLMRYAITAFRRAAEVGIETIVFGSGAARMLPDGYSRQKAMEEFGGLLRQLGPIAQERGITIVVEPLNKGECNFINSLAEGAEVVEHSNHPNVRLLADSYHMLIEGEPASEIARFGHIIGHTHVAELAGRGFPGKSRQDFKAFFRALQQSGYRARIALECKWGDMASEIAASTRYLHGEMVFKDSAGTEP